MTGANLSGLSEKNLAVEETSEDFLSLSVARGRIEPAVRIVPMESIRVAETPRLSGQDFEHIRLIAEVETSLPPVIIHRSSMHIIDGIHRFRAAQLRGFTHIAAVYFDGNEIDAFVLAVKANISHGMPLTLADRTAAAERILSSHPHWSDGAIAACTGLATKTVAGVRRRSTRDLPELNSRLGRDGKTRPTDPASGRERAAQLLIEHPESSLREIARAAGVSPATVQNVRARLQRGEAAVSPQRVRKTIPARTRNERPEALAELMHSLRKDPSVRLSESGRVLLRLLSSQPLEGEIWEEIMTNMPPHCTEIVARLAKHHALNWGRLADELAKRQPSARQPAG